MMIPSDRNRCWHSRLGNSFVAGGAITLMGAIAFSGTGAFAQIQADETLGTTVNSSTVLPCTTSCTIEGGTQVGNNLFHSFSSFSIRDGYIADFLINNHTIANILARVTGGSASDIQGLIRAGENANLFLINPNGIIFGQNAQLDIGGSFVGTTANAIAFPGGGEFSLTSSVNPQNSLLSVNPSAFLFNQIANQPSNSIEVKGTLAVGENQSLLLVGGNVSPNVASTGGIVIDGGTLQAPGGQVELGGVAGAGRVGLDVEGNTLRLSFPDGVDRADVSLVNGAEVNVVSGRGGSIAINARNIDVLQGSGMRAGIGPLSGSDSTIAGDISLNATGTTKIENGFIYNAAIGIGKAGNIRIDTRQLIVRDGVVATATVSDGDAGDIFVNASESVELTASPSSNGRVSFDIPINFFEAISITVPIGVFAASLDVRNIAADDIPVYLNPFIPQPRGDVGNLTINTGQLIVRDGAWLATNTGGGMLAGELTVNARESVELSGTSANGRPSFLSSGTRGAGDAKPLTINTQRLIVSDGGIISAGTAGSGGGADLTINASESVELIGTSRQGLSAPVLEQILGDSGVFVFDIVEERPFPSGIVTGTVGGTGNAGSLTIYTGRLLIQGGAQASVSTFGAGDAGSLSVHASSVELTGTSQQPNPSDLVGRSLLTTAVGADSTGKGGELRVQANSLTITDGAALTASTSGQGGAGNIIVRADTVDVTTGAQVNVSSEGTGDAGNLDVAAGSIFLDNQGAITATTRSGNGGDITLQAEDLLLLRRNSEISTEAGMNQAGGNGGNITIDAGFIVAVPEEDSNIAADAFEGNGGNINITTQGIFGIEFREQETPESDITATSEFGVDGVVELNTPDVDPSRGLANLPVEPTEPEVVQSCQPGESPEQSEFVVTGRGGLPPDSQEAVRTEEAFVDLVTLDSEVEKHSASVPWASPTRSRATPIVEATRWIIGSNGEVVLAASVPTVTPYSPGLTPATCSAS